LTLKGKGIVDVRVTMDTMRDKLGALTGRGLKTVKWEWREGDQVVKGVGCKKAVE